MSRRITESEIKRITNLVINESNYDLEMVHGVSYNKQTELIDDVINRIKEHGNEYMMELSKLNYKFPVEKYKRIERQTPETFELPKGVRVKSTVFPRD
jgi:vacuolar-type H+-ATPase catalytic subunit A/Vma1